MIKSFIKEILKINQKAENLEISDDAWNVLFDKEIKSTDDDQLTEIGIDQFNTSIQEFNHFISNGELDRSGSLDFIHKKALEFFFSFAMLEPQSDDILLDAAGGEPTFADAVSKIVGCKCYLNDHLYKYIEKKDNIFIVGGDATEIQLPDASITKITCHHSFEHFHDNKDTEFINEIYRLLRPNGEVVIIPIFIAQEYYETWNKKSTKHFDPEAETFFEKNSSLPGSENTGFFARVYDIKAFERRVLDPAKAIGFNTRLYNCLLDGSQTPDMQKNHGAKINYPMRALFLKKL
jgi:predicted SAM-dependent methyltransferase